MSTSDLTAHFEWINQQRTEFNAFLQGELAKTPRPLTGNDRNVSYARPLHAFDDYLTTCGVFNSGGKLALKYDTNDPKIRHLDPRIVACSIDNKVIKNLFEKKN